MRCKGLTLLGKSCHRIIRAGDYCFQHINKYRERKPKKCIICYESMINERSALNCGHWIHIQCIVNSAKEECPICRKKVRLNLKNKLLIERLAKKRRQEMDEQYIIEYLETEIIEFLDMSLNEEYGYVDFF